MQESSISEKDYVFINEEINRYKASKEFSKKIKCPLIDFVDF